MLGSAQMEVFVSNTTDIQVYDNNVVRHVFADHILETLDCSPTANPVDRQVYWIASEGGRGVIKRGFPSNNSMQTVSECLFMCVRVCACEVPLCFQLFFCFFLFFKSLFLV